MAQVKGQEVLDLLQSGEATLSEDRTTIVRKGTDEVIARRIARADGTDYFKATDEEMMADCVSVCLKWEVSKDLNIEVCVKWGCEETH